MTQLSRPERRRAERLKAGEGLAIAVESLSLGNHWHVDAVAYSHEQDGQFLGSLHLHNLATNDLVLCETYVLRSVKPLSGPRREHVAIEQATMCPDPTACKAVQEPDLIGADD
jgi:hypothetical protein